ncbi:MAG: hypothetical protein ABEL51_13595 [Salinibacter sp.]
MLESVRWYVDCGDDDFFYEGNSRLHIILRNREIPREYRVRDGAHNWTYWRNHIGKGLAFIGESFPRGALRPHEPLAGCAVMFFCSSHMRPHRCLTGRAGRASLAGRNARRPPLMDTLIERTPSEEPAPETSTPDMSPTDDSTTDDSSADTPGSSEDASRTGLAVETSPVAKGAAGVGFVAFVSLGVLAVASADAFEALVQLVVQLGVPLALVVYVAWRRFQAIQARRAAAESADVSLAQVALRQGRAALARGIAAFGGGFYGLVAAGAFLVYQVRTVPRTWLVPSAWHVPPLQWPSNELAFLTETVGGTLWGMLLDVGIGWVDGFVFGMMWPVHLMGLIGPVGLAVAMGLGVGAVHLARRLVPDADAFAQEIEAADPGSVWSPLPADLTPEGSGTAPGDHAADAPDETTTADRRSDES